MEELGGFHRNDRVILKRDYGDGLPTESIGRVTHFHGDPPNFRSSDLNDVFVTFENGESCWCLLQDLEKLEESRGNNHE